MRKKLYKLKFLLSHSNFYKLLSTDWGEYLEAYPDVKGSKLDAAFHYFRYGMKENRKIGKKLKTHIIKWNSLISNLKKRKIAISYVVLAYNSQDYIEGCLKSIITQLDSNDEIIVVDDGSVDRTVELSSSILNPVANSRIICHGQNKGILEAHRTGVKYSKNKFLTFVDGDDQLLPTFGSISKNILFRTSPDLLCFKWLRSFPDPKSPDSSLSNQIKYKILSPSLFFRYFRSSLPINIHIGLNRKIFKKSILETALSSKIPDVLFGEDLCVQTVINRIANKIVVSDSAPYIWFYRQTSVTNVPLTEKWFKDTEKSLRFIEELIEDQECIIRLKKAVLQDGLDRIDSNTSLTKAQFLVKKICNQCNFTSQADNFWLRVEAGKAICRSSISSPKSGILIVDHSNFRLLKNEFSDDLKSFVNEEIQINDLAIGESDSIESYIDRVVIAQGHKLIISSVGWWGPDFLTTTPVIQLWHGIGILKKVPTIVLPLIAQPCWAICSGEKIRRHYASLFNTGINQVFPLGGILANKLVSLKREARYKQKFLHKSVILYCPTFRLVDDNYVNPDFLNFDLIEEELMENEVLIVRLHPSVKMNKSEYPNLTKIIFSQNEDIRQDLLMADFFVTDYSSSLWYACLMDLPMFFWVPDLENYKHGNRGILLSFEEESVPGSVIRSPDFGDLIKAIRDNRDKKTQDKYAKLREKFRKDILDGCQTSNTHEICRKIKLTYEFY